MLFGSLPLNRMMGKNDTEIINNVVIIDEEITHIIHGLKPEDLGDMDISSMISDATRICNLTDVITKSFGIPCRFFEIVDNLALDVYKCPVFNPAGEIIATAGSLVDITEIKAKKLIEVETLVAEGKAFPIGKTKNFYLLRDYCDVFTCF